MGQALPPANRAKRVVHNPNPQPLTPNPCSAATPLSLALLALLPPILAAQIYLSNLPANHPAIRYMEGPVDDPVSRLIQRGVKLEPREGFGYLPSLLEQLGIRPDSQALVFSKTSFQAGKISPRNPRAIYFTDDAAVGWVRGSDSLEVAATDPQRGTIFYTLTAVGGQPRFTRQDVCLKCHQGASTLGVPGIFIGSVFPNASGMPRVDAPWWHLRHTCWRVKRGWPSTAVRV